MVEGWKMNKLIKIWNRMSQKYPEDNKEHVSYSINAVIRLSH